MVQLRDDRKKQLEETKTEVENFKVKCYKWYQIQVLQIYFEVKKLKIIIWCKWIKKRWKSVPLNIKKINFNLKLFIFTQQTDLKNSITIL